MIDLGGSVLDFFKRDVINQAELFTDHQIFTQRVLSVSASSASIVFCVVGIYLLIAIDPKRFIFRHQLIFFLLMFDLLKALILLLYPARVLSDPGSYDDIKFCQVVGFFTATAIQGADIAILAFAVHTYLLIFKPKYQTKVKNSSRTEGGLYRFRYYVYVLSFLIPLVFASLAFISRSGYDLFVCWCYLPQRPVWYRFVLSWVPRYCILITIFIIYGIIYFHVIQEFKSLGGMFTKIHRSQALHPFTSKDEKPTFFSAFKFFISRMTDLIAPRYVLPDAKELKERQELQKIKDEELRLKNIKLQKEKLKKSQQQQQNHHQKEEMSTDLDNDNDETDVDEGSVDPTQIVPPEIDNEQILYDPELQQQNLANFRKRQKIIEKQMKSIFIYPFAYCFIWLFPFILQATQVNHEQKHGPIVWLNYLGAFMQPLPGFVDTCVLFYREQPWKYTAMAIFEKEQNQRMDSLIGLHAGRGADDDSDNTSGRFTRVSVGAKLVDIQSYKSWRKWLSYLRLPLFRLPDNVSAKMLQEKYMQNRVDSEHAKATDNPDIHVIRPTITNRGIGIHDFSDVLAGDFTEQEFRENLNNFSLNFDKRNLKNISQRKRQSSTMSSLKSHPISSSKDPLSVNSRPTSRMSMSHPRSSRSSLHPKDAQIQRAHSDQQIYSRSSNSPTRQSMAAHSMDDSMDFLQFLRAGPPT